METFIEPFMFPIEVQTPRSKKIYYLYGAGYESIKDGQIFRKVINGQNIIMK